MKPKGNIKKKLHIKKNDVIEVIAGKEKGKRGKILKVIPEKERAVVEHLNMIKRHTRPSQSDRRGGIVEREGTLHVSNLLLVCPKCDKGVRTGKKMMEDGKKVRICRKCGEVLDK